MRYAVYIMAGGLFDPDSRCSSLFIGYSNTTQIDLRSWHGVGSREIWLQFDPL
jgi:hypothetical protein